MDFILDLLGFGAKALVIVLALTWLIYMIASLVRQSIHGQEGTLTVTHLNRRLTYMHDDLRQSLMPRGEAKKLRKKRRKEDKKLKPSDRHRVFVLDFVGDLAATAVHDLREVLNALIPELQKGDEVLLRIESPGGKAHSYGFAASQLKRIRDREIPLTVCIDRMAASGGYMMACVADRIVASPFALVGSIGVMAMLPNLHRFLKKHDIDYEELTSGQYKRTVSMLGEITDEGKTKFAAELDEFHATFKDYVKTHRPEVNIETVATGEVFYGQRALDLNLVDELRVSDDVLMELTGEKDVYQVSYRAKPDVRTRLADWFSRILH